MPDYSVELYDLNNQMVMDISRFVNISWENTLNDTASLSFTISLPMFEKLCADINVLPRNLIYPQKTEVKLKRNGVYLFGGIISSADSKFDTNSKTLEVKADSYLHYFATRLLNKNYTNTQRSQIAWNAISTVQSVQYGNLGVTQGVLANTYQSDATFDYQDVKSIIQRYTWAKPTTYDFEITPHKVFNTYLRLGSDKPEVELVYPQNIVSMTIPRSADSLYNKVIGIGSGMGEERIETIKNAPASQLTYRIREAKKTYNSISEMTTLEQNTEGFLAESTEPLVIPEITVEPNALDISSVFVGDSVKVRAEGSTYNDDLDGMFRIFKLSVSVNENLHEDIKVSFYNPNTGGGLDE